VTVESTIFWDVRLLVRPSRGWEDNIKMVLKEIRWESGT
jgi:hypothetical protein